MTRKYRAKAIPTTSPGYNSYYQDRAPKVHPFGPAMADWVFDVDHYGSDCVDVYDEDDEIVDVLPYEEQWYQSEMDLETVEQKASRLENEIKRFQNAYNRMAIAALKWHYLMVDCEDNIQIEKMFKDMQLMRKLSGSDNV